MSATIKTWSDNNPPTLNDDDLNGFKLENNNAIEGSGQVLSTSDNQQTHKALSIYAAYGQFYTESGIADAYVLGVQGSRVAPPAYADGMKVRFIAGNTNTGASTINVATLGVKNIKTQDGVDPFAGVITTGEIIHLEYDITNGWFVITSGWNKNRLATLESLAADTAPVFEDNAGREIGQLCKAWVNFDGTGVVAIRDSFNVSSITDNGVGNYTVNFTNALANANYSINCTVAQLVADVSYRNAQYSETVPPTTAGFVLYTVFVSSTTNRTLSDQALVSASAYSND